MKKSVYAFLATVLLAVLVMPIAFAGAADGPQATSSANGTAALKKQLKGLKQRIAALEAKQDPAFPKALPPNGPAGGDLTGTYPNPVIKPNAITKEKLGPESVTEVQIAANAVSSQEISDYQVAAIDMAADSVGSFALKGLHKAVSPNGTAISAGNTGTAKVSCGPGEMIIAGGFAWSDKEANSMIASAPSEANPNTEWVVEGFVPAGSNTLYAWATCLTV